MQYRENPKIGNYPSSACPYNKCKIIHAGRVGQFPIFGFSLYRVQHIIINMDKIHVINNYRENPIIGN
jgi:hypothetical protein